MPYLLSLMLKSFGNLFKFPCYQFLLGSSGNALEISLVTGGQFREMSIISMLPRDP